MSTFRGITPVVHLPVAAGDVICYSEIRPQVDHLIAAGADAIVTLGLATETWTLSDAERLAVFESTVEAVAGRVPTFAGVDGWTAAAVQRAGDLVEGGAAGLMVRPPHGVGLAGLREHYLALANATNVPILIQDSPQATGVQLRVVDLLELADAHPLLRSVKIEEPGAGAKVTQLAASGVDVIAGWGGLHYPENLQRGAVGCMPGADLGPAFVEIHRLARDVSPDKAEDLYRKILPLLTYEAQSLELMIIGAKSALVRAGIFSSAALRSPGGELDEVQRATLAALFEQLAEDEVPGW